MADRERVQTFCPECGTEYDDPELNHCPEDGSRLRELKSASEDDPLLGEVLDERFRIESLLGEGGMGRVYVGEQLSVDRPVAIKTLRPAVSSEEVVAKRFMRESQVISKFSHPNIVNLIDFGRDGERGILYLVLELVEGIPVNDLLELGRLTPQLAVHIVEQLCGGLAEAHAEGVIHRDLKPENMMMVPHSDGRVEAKLLDFGIAHAVQDRNKDLTASGAIVGTPYYLAPEQAQSEDVGVYTDVYAMGIILFEMLTGHQPVDGESTMELLLQHIEGEVPKLGSWVDAGEVPDALIQLVEAMTAVEPSERPGSALEVRKRLVDISREAGWGEIFVDPSDDDPEEIFEPWLRPRVEPSRTSAESAPEVTTDPGESHHRTDEHRPESAVSEFEEGVGEQRLGVAETAPEPADSEPAAESAPAAESTPDARVDGGEEVSGRPKTRPENPEASTERAAAEQTDDDETFSVGVVRSLVIGLVGLLAVLGGAVYVLQSESGGSEQAQTASGAESTPSAGDGTRAAGGGPEGGSAAETMTGPDAAVGADTDGGTGDTGRDTDVGAGGGTEAAPGAEAESESGGRPGDDSERTGESSDESEGTSGSREATTDSPTESTTDPPAAESEPESAPSESGSESTAETAPETGGDGTDPEDSGSSTGGSDETAVGSDESTGESDQPADEGGSGETKDESFGDQKEEENVDPGFFPAE